MNNADKHLFRSRQNRIIAGVCGGSAEYLAVDPTIVRIVFVLLTVIPHGVGLLAYIIMIIVVPEEPGVETAPVDSSHSTASFVRSANGRIETSESTSWLSQRRNIFGLAVILLGVASLVRVMIPNVGWADNLFWPLLVIFIGAYLIFTTKRK